MIKSSASDIEWRTYGELEYGASDNLSAGLEEWSLLKTHLHQLGLDRMQTCVELGCGCGRLTNALKTSLRYMHSMFRRIV
jgi:hypothetical protein